MSRHIFDLPTEVIEHIFSFVPQKKDRRNLSLICKKFQSVIRQQSRKHNHLDLLVKRKSFSSLLIFEQSDEFPFEKLSLRLEHIEEYNGLWLKHGAEITQMILVCGLNQLIRFGRGLNELFPNLKLVMHHLPDHVHPTTIVFRPNSPPLEQTIDHFSDKIEYLCLTFTDGDFKQLDMILELFPGLKYLILSLGAQECFFSEAEVKEFKNLLEKWLSKLERIQLNFHDFFTLLKLIKAFDGLADEKLRFGNFGDFLANFKQVDLNDFKSFFSNTRHIGTLNFGFGSIVLDSTICSLIDQNATVDRLIIYINHVAQLNGLINARCIKEIMFHGVMSSSFENIRFTPESLSKVKEINLSCGNVLRIPLFRNLQKLTLENFTIGNEELDFIVSNFPFLEYLNIVRLFATNGYAMVNLKHLRCLEIENSLRLSDSFFDFGAILPNLETLRINGAPDLSIVGCKYIIKNCPNIQMMELDRCFGTTQECFELFARKLFYINKIELNKENRSFYYLQKKYPELFSISEINRRWY